MATLADIQAHLMSLGDITQKEIDELHPTELESRYDKCLVGSFHTFLRTFGELDCVVVANARRPLILVVLFHGYGANHYDLVELGEIFFPQHGANVAAAFIFPCGSVEMGEKEFGRVESEFGSFKWWSIINVSSWKTFFGENGFLRGVRDPYIDVPEGLALARSKVIACIHDAERTMGVESHNVALAGFSQGSMLALDLFFHMEGPPLALALWSSTVMCKQLWRDRMSEMSPTYKKQLKDVPIFISHGSRDYIIPVPVAKALHTFLSEEGFSYAYKQFRGSHEIPNDAAEEFYEILMGYRSMQPVNKEFKVDDGLRSFLRPGTKFTEPNMHWQPLPQRLLEPAEAPSSGEECHSKPPVPSANAVSDSSSNSCNIQVEDLHWDR